MTRKTLGQALGIPDQTDSSVAAGVYVPRYRGNDVSDTAIDQQNDIKESLRDQLRTDYVDAHLESENQNTRSETYEANYNSLSNGESIDAEAFSILKKSYLPIDESDDEVFKQLRELVPGKRNDGSPTYQVIRNAKLAEIVSSNLLGTNRFNVLQGFHAQNSNEKEAFRRGLYTIQSEQGEYRPDSEEINVDDLKEGASRILFAARNDYIQSADAVFLPNVNSDELRIKNQIEKLKKANLLLDSNDHIFKVRPQESYGVGNRPLVSDESVNEGIRFLQANEFNDVTHFGTMGLVLKSAAYSLVLGSAFSALFALFVNNGTKSTVYDSVIFQSISFLLPPQYKRAANEYGVRPSFNRFHEDLGEGFNFFEYFFAGLRAFYGFSRSPNVKNGSDWQTLISFNPRVIADSPTYHYGIARTLLRELQDLRASDSALALLSKSLRDLSASANLRFYVMLLKLGYIISNSGFASEADDSLISGAIGLIGGNPSRTATNGSNGLVYGEAANNDDVNIRVLRRAKLFGSSMNPAGASRLGNPLSLRNFDYVQHLMVGGNYKDRYGIDKPQDESFRIPREVVEAVEREIDVEYVPFSIQDLRNNQVMSLPAFLDSVSDNFSVTYESNHGYGRTDPVHTYSKTERNIELTFHLVAFNEPDHVRLYEVLNRLTSMCYPQRSRGIERLTTSGNRFYQPFSQVQTASPMVRLRLGSMIASNYSRRGLRKLFGEVMGVKETTNASNPSAEYIVNDHVDGLKPIDEQHAQIAEEIRKLESETKKIRNNDFKPGQQFVVALKGPPLVFVRDTIPALDETKSPLNNATRNVPYTGGPVILEYVRTRRDRKLTFKAIKNDAFKAMMSNAPRASYVDTIYKDTRKQAQYYVTITNPSETFDTDRIDARIEYLREQFKEYVVAANDRIKRFNERQRSLLSSGESFENDFETAKANPIVRAFESSMGRGLAGFIKSLNIDYNGSTWRTNVSGREVISGLNREHDTTSNHLSVAPLRVKVTMSFAPVHDLPLGLDYRGELLAPSHPVGFWNSDGYEKLQETEANAALKREENANASAAAALPSANATNVN
jgi:hypothetical protein